MTFENFRKQGRPGISQNEANSLEAAYTMAKEYSETLLGWLVLQGPVGCGKTHLVAAIANRAASRDVPTLFLAVPDLLDKIRNSYNGSGSDGFESLFLEIQRTPFLVLDDYGAENMTDWAREKIFQVINYRYINQLPTVVTTNSDLLQADDRTSSRLVDIGLSVLVRIEAPDYRKGSVISDSSSLSSIQFPPGIADREFDNFNVNNFSNLDENLRKNIGSALQAAKKYAAKQKCEGWIVFYGKGNSGKTHLASAIANRRKEKGSQVVFCVVPDLLDRLRSSYSSPSVGSGYHQMLEDIRSAELLILDDLNTVSATNWAKEKLYQIVNYRYNYYLPTVITTSYSLSDLDSRIRSRLMDTKLCSAYHLGR
jgi:DNA replication protein DnaC